MSAAELRVCVYAQNARGLTALLRQIVIAPNQPQLDIVYVQPQADGTSNCISFDDFARVVERHDDELSLRFAQSLRQWAQVEAGARRGSA